MKNNLLKFYMLAFFLVSDFVMFAQQDPGEDNPTDDLEGGDNLPINSKLIYLGLAGISFAFYLYNRKKHQQVEN